MASKRSSQRSRRDVVGEQDEERIVAGERALLLGQGQFVDGLGDDAGRAGRAGQDEDQAAPADRHRDVGEDAPQALVRGRPRAPSPFAARSLGREVDVAVGARRLEQAELGDVAADRRLGDVEALLDEGVDELALAADRPDATSWRIARWRSRLSSCRGRRHAAAPTRAVADGRDPRPERRVVEGALQGAVRGRVGDDRLGALPAERGQRRPDLGHHAAGDDARRR